jgi:hypothetical protein
VQTRTNEFKVFSKEVKEITLICSKQVSSLDIPTVKTTLGLCACVLHNNGKDVRLSMVIFVQNLQGRKEKLYVICNSNLDCKRVANTIDH